MNKNNNFSILILTLCSKKTGTGNLKRSLQLQQSLLKEKINCEIWTDQNIETKKIINTLKYKAKIKCFKKITLKIQDYKKFRLVVIDIAWNDLWLDANSSSLIKLIEKLERLNIRVVNIGKPKLETSLFRSFIDIYPDGSQANVSGNVSPRFIALRKEFRSARLKNNRVFKGSIFI